jgi:hypothetical protein
VSDRRAVVIAGGYLSNPVSYGPLANVLRGAPYYCHVEQVQVTIPTWLGVRARDFRPVANAIRAAVERARQACDGPLTIVGHSAGGFVSRIFLGDELYHDVRYGGHRLVSRLITLGSPHLSQEYFTRPANSWVNATYPGAFYAHVAYTTVAGTSLQGDARGSLRQRVAAYQYRTQSGNGNEWGDGVVPVSVAHLEGATQLNLPGVQHFQGRPNGYDDPRVVALWGRSLEADQSAVLAALTLNP